MTNPATGGGALNCRSGRFDASEYTAPISSTQQAGAAMAAPLTGPHFERAIEHLHRLGPRPLAELLIEIAKATGEPGLIADRIAAYAALDPEIVRFVGGNHFPKMPLTVIG